MEEFKNSDTNHLGIPLPKGKLRFYRSDSDGHLGIRWARTRLTTRPKTKRSASTPATPSTWSANASATNLHVESNQRWMDESFEIRVRNHKKEAVNVRVVEHLYRCNQLEARRPIAPVTQNGCADGRVPRVGGSRWRSGGDIYGALLVVGSADPWFGSLGFMAISKIPARSGFFETVFESRRGNMLIASPPRVLTKGYTGKYGPAIDGSWHRPAGAPAPQVAPSLR